MKRITVRRMRQTQMAWAPRQSETDIIWEIIRALNLTGACKVWRNNTGEIAHVRFGLGNGGPDIVGILKPWGRFFGIECKTPEGKISKDQRTWHADAVRLGAYVGFARSLEDAVELLNLAREDTAARWQPSFGNVE